jgi:hypothetical protein
MKRLCVLAWLIATSCGPLTIAESETWTTRSFTKFARADQDFGGLSSRTLAVAQGDLIPWRSRPFDTEDFRQGSGFGLALYPAFAQGKTASMLITEVWENHPTPWVQPVYQFVKGGSPIRGIFAVGVESTFYTPFWRAERASVPDETGPAVYTSAASVLDAKLSVTQGSMVVCPIIPSDLNVAAAPDETVALRPLSGEPVNVVAHSQAWVDGATVDYFGVGLDRITVTETGLPVETPIYFFVSATGATLSLPAILVDDATRHSLHRRYDIVLPASFGVFVSANRPELKSYIQGEGVHVPEADPAIADAVAKPYLLRVATNPECFKADGGFPSGCHWLDSQTAVEAAIGQDIRRRTETLMTVSTLQGGVP